MAETRILEREVLEGKVIAELQEIAGRVGVSGFQRLKKSDLISAILNATSADGKDETKADGKPSRSNGPRSAAKAVEPAAEAPAAEAPAAEVSAALPSAAK